MRGVFQLQFLTNCDKWETVQEGSHSLMFKALDRRAKLFHDAHRYKIIKKPGSYLIKDRGRK